MTLRKRRPGLQWACTALILLFVVAPNSGWGQAGAPAVSAAPLPPAAQEALNKGIIAAKVPDYLLAIRYFAEARKLAPTAPVIFMNLGIAESKMPGRELRAIAWFGAYLAATPDAPNAAAVKEQIAVLEVRNQSNVSRFLKTVQAAADLIKDDHGLGLVRSLAKVQIKAGDLPGARKNLASAARTEIGRTLGDARVKTMVLTSIAKEQINAGDLRGARGTLESAQQTADRIRELPQYKASEQREVAEAQIVAGDLAGSQKTLASMHKTTALIKDPGPKSSQTYSNSQIQTWIDAAQAKAANAAAPSSDPKPASSIPPSQLVSAVSDWLKKLDDDNKNDDCALNTELFLDLPGYLKSLPPSDDSNKIFEGLLEPADKMTTAQNVIHQMLKQPDRK
jgi:tetratricopeptide (TPR) repeat protein